MPTDGFNIQQMNSQIFHTSCSGGPNETEMQSRLDLLKVTVSLKRSTDENRSVRGRKIYKTNNPSPPFKV